MGYNTKFLNSWTKDRKTKRYWKKNYIDFLGQYEEDKAYVSIIEKLCKNIVFYDEISWNKTIEKYLTRLLNLTKK